MLKMSVRTVLSQLSGKNKKYPDFFKSTGYGTATGLKGVNCTHEFYPFWEGADFIPDDIEEPKPVKINGKTYDYYQVTQKQRQMERNIRATKREIEAQRAIGGDAAELQSKLQKQTGIECKRISKTVIRDSAPGISIGTELRISGMGILRQ